MDAKKITFDSLPQAVAYLVNEVTAIKQLVENRQNPVIAERRLPIGIDAACQIIGKAIPISTTENRFGSGWVYI
jgi:galactitol-specific phosphotransferase system IIC component